MLQVVHARHVSKFWRSGDSKNAHVDLQVLDDNGFWIIIAWYVYLQGLCAICPFDSTALRPNLQGIFTSKGRPKERVI